VYAPSIAPESIAGSSVGLLESVAADPQQLKTDPALHWDKWAQFRREQLILRFKLQHQCGNFPNSSL
jgi:hypothetical protein